MSEYQHRARKRFGQNFLHDAGIIHRMAPEAELVSVRAFGPDGKCSRDGLLTALRYCVRERFSVVNLSLGIEATGRDLPHADVVDYARRKGVTVVAASGNDGSATTRFFPAAIPYVVTVGATDTTGAVATFSTFGAPVDLVAPGTDIYSSYLEKGYAFSSGSFGPLASVE